MLKTFIQNNHKLSYYDYQMRKVKSVVVYCAASKNIKDSYFQAANELGKLLAANEITVVNGSGAGLMKAVSDSAIAAGGSVTGIIPKFMIEREWENRNVTNFIETTDMHERKRMFFEKADAVVALPGGIGTLDELAEAICWKTLELIDKPIVILNTNGYYKPFLKMIKKAIEEKFMSDDFENAWSVANTPEEVLNYLL
jgi:uncharacterized protein (TIGR00730 family)